MCHTVTRIETSVDQFVTKFNQCTLLSLSNIIGWSFFCLLLDFVDEERKSRKWRN